jgi:O-acetyl-ADP-ribose deacetylase (regulator of RNase III)
VIHRAAGPEPLAACRTVGGRDTGDAKVTPVTVSCHVGDTVGPVWRGGTAGGPERLARCYRRSPEVADRVGAESVAFPAISAGVDGCPIESAAEIAVREIRAWSAAHDPSRVVLCTFGADATAAIERAIAAQV